MEVLGLLLLVAFGMTVFLASRPGHPALPAHGAYTHGLELEEAGPGVQLLEMSRGWQSQGRERHYVWAGRARLPSGPGEAWAELTLVRRNGEALEDGEGLAPFRRSSGPVPEHAEPIPSFRDRRLGVFRFEFEATPEDLPRRADGGELIRGRAKIVLGVGPRAWIAFEVPFTHHSRLAPGAMVRVTAVKDGDASPPAGAAICQVCGDGLAGAVRQCSRCGTPHHEECWRYIGRCATFGCR